MKKFYTITNPSFFYIDIYKHVILMFSDEHYFSYRTPMMVRPGEDVLLGLLPFYHIYGLVIVQFGALARGTKLVTIPRFEPNTFLEAIQNHRV